VTGDEAGQGIVAPRYPLLADALWHRLHRSGKGQRQPIDLGTNELAAGARRRAALMNLSPERR
jgi:hypothetical protein